jgi:hypothetical protein
MAAALVLCVGAVMAQPGSGKGPGPGPAASAPRMGMGMGMGRWGSDFTPGWSLMTPQERNEHRERMRNAKTYDECKAAQQQHHEQMAARAKERGGKPLAQPRRDACAGMKR